MCCWTRELLPPMWAYSPNPLYTHTHTERKPVPIFFLNLILCQLLCLWQTPSQFNSPPSSRGAGGGLESAAERVPAHLRADSLATDAPRRRRRRPKVEEGRGGGKERRRGRRKLQWVSLDITRCANHTPARPLTTELIMH
ncbi:hypothetical protein PoB_001577300 [Plakobranchus ocellatus]|uniref:Uncharacterized protein n=1 Tax=Plakobranchus ocellatus TaxID=259542 RepID=A0AAV3Z3E9_9GAST|nr:hypothetical protein PoB_001577300 [Plakobranchus ocellatus]